MTVYFVQTTMTPHIDQLTEQDKKTILTSRLKDIGRCIVLLVFLAIIALYSYYSPDSVIKFNHTQLKISENKILLCIAIVVSILLGSIIVRIKKEWKIYTKVKKKYIPVLLPKKHVEKIIQSIIL